MEKKTQHEKIYEFAKDGRDSLGHYIKGHHSGMSGKKHRNETKRKIGMANKGKGLGKSVSIEIRHKISIANSKPKSDAHKIAMSNARKGNKSQWWRGGKTAENHIIRESVDMAMWRKAVFARDNYTCVSCGERGYIQADHIKPFAYFPELRFELSNGRTLCINCHRKTDTYGRNVIKKYETNTTREDL